MSAVAVPILYVFGPPLLVAVALGGWIYLNRAELFEIGRLLKSKTAFTPESALRTRESVEELPGTNKTSLEDQTLKQAISDLTAFAKRINPNWILGVHPGGRLLSVLIAEEIGVPGNRCLFVRTTSRVGKRITLEPELIPNEPREGTLLVIDDISRTGDTLNLVKAFLFELNYTEWHRFGDIKFAVLLVVAEPGSSSFVFRPDFVAYRTDQRGFKTPWSELSDKITTALAENRQKSGWESQETKEVIADYDRLISDHQYALSLARRYVGAKMII